MPENLNIRAIKEPQGISSCTYSEAIHKLAPRFKAADKQMQISFVLCVSVIYDRVALDVAQDLARGLP